MVVSMDLEERRHQDRENTKTLELVAAGKDAVAGPAAAALEVQTHPWMNDELRLHLQALCFQFSHEQEPKLEGAILALNMFGNMVAQARAAHIAMKADDVAEEDHVSVWLATSDLVFVSCLSRCMSILIDAFCDKTKRDVAPHWVLRRKGVEDGEAEQTM